VEGGREVSRQAGLHRASARPAVTVREQKDHHQGGDKGARWGGNTGRSNGGHVIKDKKGGATFFGRERQEGRTAVQGPKEPIPLTRKILDGYPLVLIRGSMKRKRLYSWHKLRRGR